MLFLEDSHVNKQEISKWLWIDTSFFSSFKQLSIRLLIIL